MPKRGSAVTAWGGLLGLASCVVVGRDYEPPDLNVPTAWEAPAESRADEFDVLSQWWTTLGDEVLDGLVAAAIEHNFDLEQALHRIDVVRASRGVAVSELGPLVTSDGGYTNSYLGTRAFGISPGDRTFELFEASLNASWELDLFGRIRRGIEAADAEIGASVEDYRSVLIVVVAEVVRRYVDLRSFELRVAIATENVRNQEETLQIAEARVDGGLAPQLDVLRARTNLAQTQAAVPLLEQGRVEALNALRVLVGAHADELSVGHAGELPTLPANEVVTVPLETIRRRPDVRRFERSLAAETARVGVAESELYPRLFVNGSVGLAATDVEDLDGRALVTSFGPSFSWNVFTSGLVSSLVAAQEARVREAHARWAGTVVLALAEVENAISGLARQGEQTARLDVAVENARAARQQSQDLYGGGLTDFNAVLDADQTRLAVEDNRARSRTAELQRLVDLYLALGGGWRVDEPTPERDDVRSSLLRR